jgi:hypothetical protein
LENPVDVLVDVVADVDVFVDIAAALIAAVPGFCVPRFQFPVAVPRWGKLDVSKK